MKRFIGFCLAAVCLVLLAVPVNEAKFGDRVRNQVRRVVNTRYEHKQFRRDYRPGIFQGSAVVVTEHGTPAPVWFVPPPDSMDAWQQNSDGTFSRVK